jgi:hypothetical protein
MESSSKSRLPVFRGDGSPGDDVNTFLLRIELAMFLQGGEFRSMTEEERTSAGLNEDQAKAHLERKKIAFLAQCLEGAAAQWFTSMLNGVSMTELAPDTTYSVFLQDFKNAFTDGNAEVAARLQLAALNYAAPLSAFIIKFNAIDAHIPDDSEASRVFAFSQKLPPAMSSFVMVSQPKTLQAAITAARIYEGAYSTASPTPAHVSTSQPSHSSSLSAGLASLDVNSKDTIIAELLAMQRGDSRGPRKQAASFSSQSSTRPRMPDADFKRCMEERRCLKCKKVGHTAKECRGQYSTSFPASS